MNERRLAFAWHVVDLTVAVVGLAWSAYHLWRALNPAPLVEAEPGPRRPFGSGSRLSLTHLEGAPKMPRTDHGRHGGLHF